MCCVYICRSQPTHIMGETDWTDSGSQGIYTKLHEEISIFYVFLTSGRCLTSVMKTGSGLRPLWKKQHHTFSLTLDSLSFSSDRFSFVVFSVPPSGCEQFMFFLKLEFSTLKSYSSPERMLRQATHDCWDIKLSLTGLTVPQILTSKGWPWDFQQEEASRSFWSDMKKLTSSFENGKLFTQITSTTGYLTVIKFSFLSHY